MSKTPEKLCIFCEHFDWEGVGYVHYSTLTGGDDTGGATCKKNYYFERRPDNQNELRAIFLKAEKCTDYSREGNL